jgi:hypothetical protein
MIRNPARQEVDETPERLSAKRGWVSLVIIGSGFAHTPPNEPGYDSRSGLVMTGNHFQIFANNQQLNRIQMIFVLKKA